MKNYKYFKFPSRYSKFLSEMKDDENYIIENTDITLYAQKYLEEINQTYEVQEFEADFFLIGQDGELGFFIKNDNSDTIYINELDSLGLVEMKSISPNIYDFIKYAKEHYDEI